MNLILFGFKSCGKTTLGQRVAKQLGRPFLDTDQLLFSECGMSCRDLYKAVGEEAFRNLESALLKRLVSHSNTIIAAGGGLILDPRNAALLTQLGALIYLKCDKQTLKKRILEGPLPAFLDPTDPESAFEQMYKERLPKYEAINATAVDVKGKTLSTLTSEIIHRMALYGK